MRKHLVAGAAVLALLMNAPHVSADDDVVIFGGEFEDELPASKAIPESKTVEENSKPVEKSSEPVENSEPVNETSETAKISGERDEPAPVEISQRTPPAPASEHTVIRRLPKNDPSAEDKHDPVDEPIATNPIEHVNEPAERVDEPTELDRPFEPVNEPIATNPIEPVNEPTQPVRRPRRSSRPSTQQNLRQVKQRFIKLAVDDTYTYYLDKTSVQWKRMPYSASEYMADVWIRMVELKPKPVDDDMVSYGAENFNAEISFAREQGYQYSPEDLQVLQSQSYVLEHYYLRPKTKQIQFLCELEVFGRPQNTVNERAYDYRNWENLVPGSIESAIYSATIKIIGKSKADSKGHMTFIDMLDEYARIALN